MMSTILSSIFITILSALTPWQQATASYTSTTSSSNKEDGTTKTFQSFDKRKTISHSEAKRIYNKFAISGHIGGKDASSGYGGPAVKALVSMADFIGTTTTTTTTTTSSSTGACEDESTENIEKVQRVFDYGCGQGKLAEHVFDSICCSSTTTTTTDDSDSSSRRRKIHWHGVDQSPEMIAKFQQRLERFQTTRIKNKIQMSSSSHLMSNNGNNGNPSQLYQHTPSKHYHRFVSTYCLDLLSEKDMYEVLTLAEHALHPTKGKLLLAGITYGYKDSIRTFCMTLGWEIMYRIRPDIVGGCRPQLLVPYLEERGWIIEKVCRTMPTGFPWMVSEIICARPPPS